MADRNLELIHVDKYNIVRMGSMDFTYDLLDKIQEEKTDYLLVTLRKGRQQFKVDVFYTLENAESDEALITVLNEISESIRQGNHEQRPPREDGEDEHDEGYEDEGYEDEDEDEGEDEGEEGLV